MNEEVLKKSLGKGNRTNHPKNHKKVNYDSNINFRISKEVLEKFKEVCKQKNTEYTKVLREFIENYE